VRTLLDEVGVITLGTRFCQSFLAYVYFNITLGTLGSGNHYLRMLSNTQLTFRLLFSLSLLAHAIKHSTHFSTPSLIPSFLTLSLLAHAIKHSTHFSTPSFIPSFLTLPASRCDGWRHVDNAGEVNVIKHSLTLRFLSFSLTFFLLFYQRHGATVSDTLTMQAEAAAALTTQNAALRRRLKLAVRTIEQVSLVCVQELLHFKLINKTNKNMNFVCFALFCLLLSFSLCEPESSHAHTCTRARAHAFH
jgi:hypothetical protein